jgi:hypothetical protein
MKLQICNQRSFTVDRNKPISLEQQLQLTISKSMDEFKPIGPGLAKSNASKNRAVACIYWI